MKPMHTVVLAGVITFTPAAMAGNSLDAWTLGHMQGVLEVCRGVVPQQATQYLLQMKSTIGDATRSMVNEAAETEPYRQAYASVRSELGAMAREEMTQACLAYMED